MRTNNLLLIAAALFTMSCAPKNSQGGNDMDTFQTQSGKTIKVIPIKHGSIEINYNGLEIEVDPVTENVEPVTDYSQKPKADLILVTHEHYDHFDPAAIAVLSNEDTRIILTPNCYDKLKKGTAMRNGDTLKLAEDVNLYAVPAYNTTPSHTKFHPKGRDNGYILELDGTRIYIAGDMEDIPELKNVKDIDIAFMPCNQPFTMTPEQLRKAASIVRPKVLYPYHFSDTNQQEMQNQLKGLGIDVRMRDFK